MEGDVASEVEAAVAYAEAADWEPVEPGIHLFSSEGCPSCGRARSVIERTGLSFSEHTYEAEARLLEDIGISRVPTVAWVPVGGGAGWVAEGVPTERSLARWVGP